MRLSDYNGQDFPTDQNKKLEWKCISQSFACLPDKQKVVLTEDSIDISRLKSYEGEISKKEEFRPQTFDEFIGQEVHKKRIRDICLPKICNGRRNHFFFDALPSAGKTTMARLIAKELKAKFIEHVGQQLSSEIIVNTLQDINEAKEKYVVWFVDEIETMNPKFLKFLNPILEDFIISDIKIKPFVFIGATINKYKLMSTSCDTFSRYFTHIRFARYTYNEMIKIIKQFQIKTFPNLKISDEDINIIAKNSKYTPRIANDMVEDLAIKHDINTILEYRNIIKDGLEAIDINILKTLKENIKPMGAGALSAKVGINQADYEKIYEPYLVEMNYIKRGRQGRQIDNEGIYLLEAINKNISKGY